MIIVLTLPQKAHKMIKLIENQLKLLLNLVNSLLDYKMLQEGAFDVKAKDFSPSEVLKELMEIFSLQAKESGIGLKFETVSAATVDRLTSIKSVADSDCGFTLPETLNGDNVRLQQILINLVKNALKFTKRDG